MKDMLSLPGQGQIYIIIDALDECPTSGSPSAREEVLELVRALVRLQPPNVHLCITSRPEVDIQRVFEPLKPLKISLHEEKGQKEDIVNYIKSFLHSDGNMQQWTEEDQQLVINALSEKAGGMSVTSLSLIRHFARCSHILVGFSMLLVNLTDCVAVFLKVSRAF
jgi:hypothetical protein